ncbi:hypothetical protein VTH06DRAFT_8517 [Thermothelomyces fergusii]
MGNAQSIDGSRRTPQRLSKPKTGNHATSSRSRRFSNAQLPVPPEPSPTVSSTPTTWSTTGWATSASSSYIDNVAPFPPSPVSQQELKRRSLFRSRSTRDGSTSWQNYDDDPGSRPMNRVNRASSMTYEPSMARYWQAEFETRPAQSDRRTSVNYNLSSYEAKRLLNLAEEPHLERAATLSDNLTIVTETTWNPCYQANASSSPIPRTGSDISLYMPVRRRSVIQTPGVATRPSLAHDIPPLPQQPIEPYMNGAMPTEPWMAELESASRVATPCEDKYLSIGAFKLGSLRITNGFPSPATLDVDEDGDENDGSENRPAAVREGYFVKPQNSETGITPGAAVQSDMYPAEITLEMSQSPPLSPTTRERPISQGLQTTSKTTALGCQLFKDDAQPEYSSVEVLDVRPDPNAKPPHAQLSHSTGSSVKRADSGFASTGSLSSESCCKSLAKADSGYSSNVSLRSFQATSQGVENQSSAFLLEQQTSHHSNAGTEDRVGLKVENLPDRLDARRPASPEIEDLPCVSPKYIAQSSADSPSRHDISPKSVPARGLSGKETSRMPSTATITSLPDSQRPMPLEAGARDPESVSPCASRKLSSLRSITGGTPKPSRLQRLLSGARRATVSSPAVGTPHAFENDAIPPVPKEAEQKLRERPSRIQSTPKRLGLRSRPSLDTLKTIFSVGSLEASLDAVNSMQTRQAASGSENKEGAWKQSLQSVPASLANIAGHVIPKRTRAGKSVRAGQEETTQESQGSENRSKDVTRGDPAQASISAPVSPPRSGSGRRAMSLTFEGERAIMANRPAEAMAAESNNRAPETAHTTRRSQVLCVPPGLSQKASRESLQSNPTAHPSLGRQTSLRSTRSYHSSQAGVGYGSAYSMTQSRVSMDPRRLRSFRRYSFQPPPDNPPTREVHGNSALYTSQTLAGNEGRRNSITSVRSEGVYRPADGRGWQIRVPSRRQTSIEGYHGYQQWCPQYGYPPSMSNGFTAPAKTGYDPHDRHLRNGEQIMAAGAWSQIPWDAAAGQWCQGQNPQYGPRGHSRSRSIESRPVQGSNPPYRVLHSYNSPAYRHAPIWG